MRFTPARTGAMVFVHFTILLALVFALLMPAAQAAPGAVVVTPHVSAELLAHAPDGVAAGKRIHLGLQIKHQPEWHTYWKNPGDSGLPTTFAWTLPAGVTTTGILWPVPTHLPLGPLMNFGYDGTVLLPVALDIPPHFVANALPIKLRAEWLVCKEICLPESGDFVLTLPAATPITAHAASFAAAERALPVASPGTSASAVIEDDSIALTVRGLPAAWHRQQLRYFPEQEGVFEYAKPGSQSWDNDTFTLRIPLAAQRSESPAMLQFVLAPEKEQRGIAIEAALGTGWPKATQAPSAAAIQTQPSVAPPASALPFALTLLLAFAGGVLLNLMPCVFPVLALKILAFASHGQDRRSVVAGGLAYTTGVVASFVALAALLLVLRSTGAELGWGFQLQSPVFVAALCILFTLIGLNLAGTFEVGSILPGSVAGLRARHRLVDDFLSGVLAVAIASPCTAPFMGAAIGATLTQPAPAALTLFAVLGLGMAAPYLIASVWPPFARLLPRPGAWMVRFKTIMAFPMFATVVWLVWVLGEQVGTDGMAAMLGVLVVTAFFAWAAGTPAKKGPRVALIATAATVAAAAVFVAWPLITQPSMQQLAQSGSSRWQPWSPEAVTAASAAGKPVFVDFTAAWCVTCQFNKRTALADAAVLADFAARDVVLMRADWTRRDPAITRQLAELGRSGVPVYALYPADGRPPRLLAEILTVTEVRDALAAMQSPAVAFIDP